MKKIHLLEYLVNTHPEIKKNELLARVLCGEVFVDNGCIRDPKCPVTEKNYISFYNKKRYVSRGGEKLHHALEELAVDVTGMICIDAGSSTGGFTDCLLKHNAKQVYAVDVGYSQLDFSLRNDLRVIVLERTNIMDVSIDSFKQTPDIAVMDLSFRSVRKAGHHVLFLTKSHNVIALIKPQFEWQNPDKSFDGIIKDVNLLKEILFRLIDDLWQEKTFISKAAVSAIKGQKGNREFFFLLSLEKTAGIDEIKEEIAGLL